MPIVIKPATGSDPNPNPLDRRGDGFDPSMRYQMIPLGSTREMAVQTGDFEAELEFRVSNVAAMANFRVVSSRSTRLFSLPGPLTLVEQVVVPERSTFNFTLHGRSQDMTVLEGRDRTPEGLFLPADFKLNVSVLAPVSRKVAVVYAFDRINRDRGVRFDFASHLANAHKVYSEQANLSIVNVDGAAASTRAARKVTLNSSMGKAFDLLNKRVYRQLIQTISSSFPGIFTDNHCVLISVPLPLVLKGQAGILAVNMRLADAKTQQIFNTLLVGARNRRPPAKQGGPQPTPRKLVDQTVAHELGHSLGLKHHPAEAKELPAKFIRKGVINPVFFTPDVHNLMFPNQFIVSERLNGAQVERIHEFPPPIRILEI